MWYAFGLVHFVALSTFFPGPTGSTDRVYEKEKKIIPKKKKTTTIIVACHVLIYVKNIFINRMV